MRGWEFAGAQTTGLDRALNRTSMTRSCRWSLGGIGASPFGDGVGILTGAMTSERIAGLTEDNGERDIRLYEASAFGLTLHRRGAFH